MFKRTEKQLEASRLHASDATHILLYGGSRCVAGDTVLDGYSKTIEELASINQPVFVKTSHGVQIAESPFFKGEDYLYDIITETGRKITVTSDHRFFSLSGWIKVYDLEENHSIACVPLSHLPCFVSPDLTISEFSLSMFCEDVQHLKQIYEYLKGHCLLYPHLYDQQLHLLSIFDQLYYGLQCDELGRNLSYQYHFSRVLQLLGLNTRILNFYLRDKEGSLSDLEHDHFSNKDEFVISVLCVLWSIVFCVQISLQSRYSLQKYSLFQVRLVRHLSFLKVHRICEHLSSQFFDHDTDLALDTPFLDNLVFEKVCTITRTAKKRYYTLHVPFSEQYFANGILNHNSGKTFLSLRNIIMRALRCKSRHVVLRLRFNHIKTSIWYDTLPKLLNICFKDVQVKFNKTDFFIEFTNGSTIFFGGLDDSIRVEKILGNEYSTVYLNECSQIDYSSVQVVLTRLAERTILKNKIYYDCNPPNTGHWTYKLFIEKIDPISKLPLQYPDNYVSLLMNPKDNVDNISTEYLSILSSLSERERKRFEFGEFISDVEGALWSYDLIIQARAQSRFSEHQICIAVDPAVTSSANSDETGIIVCSSDGEHLNVLEDASIKASPDTWMQVIINLYDKYRANFIVVETNQGGDLITSLLNSKRKNLPVRKVHAKKGKFARAEPVVALYEQKKVWHNMNLDKLENQMLEYVPLRAKESPDRLDALVYAATVLILDNRALTSRILEF